MAMPGIKTNGIKANGKPPTPAPESALPPHPYALGGSATAPAATDWGINRIRRGEPLRIVASGLSRSGSTWQYIMLVLLIEAAVELHSPLARAERAVYATFGHDADAFTHCLAQRYCVAKAHEFLPDVLLRVHAVVTAHRDLRAVLASTRRYFSSCLLYGDQSLAAYFISYSQWLPYACYDMSYEARAAEGEVLTIQRHAAQLGLPIPEALATDLAKRVRLVTIGAAGGAAAGSDGGDDGADGDSGFREWAAAARVRDAARVWPLPETHGAHITSGGASNASARGSAAQLATTREASEAREAALAREAAATRYCNATAEARLLEVGWGGWLVRHGYVRDEHQARRLNASGSNAFVEALGQRAELMGSARIGHANLGGRCERHGAWDAEAEALGVVGYSMLRLNHSIGAPHALGAANQYHLLTAHDASNALSVLVTYSWQQILLHLRWALGRFGLVALLAGALWALRELRRSEQAKIAAVRRRQKEEHAV